MKKIICVFLAALLLVTLPESTVSAKQAPDAERVVVVLDAGHGGKDGGAVRTWNGKTYKEKTINLAIAKACKKELEKYAGVKVYMTRTDDSYVTLENRVKFAKKKSADLFVALHINSSETSAANGVTVYYPNMNYKSSIGTSGRLAALSIQKALAALGMKNNGVQICNTKDGSRYPDRSRADYYYVIKNSKCAGFPGLIVEHAFVSNYNDCIKYLSSSDKLTKLGKADASGIAAYLGLMPEGAPTLKSAETTENGTVELAWKKLSKADFYRVYRRAEDEDEYECIAERVKKTTFTDETAEPGVTYEYAVCGCKKGSVQTTYTSLSDARTVVIPAPEPTGENTESAENTENTESAESTENTEFAESTGTTEDTQTTTETQDSGAVTVPASSAEDESSMEDGESVQDVQKNS